MKRVIITGGNSGIGYQVAKQLAEKGWSVTLFCRREEAAEQACEEIRRQTGNPHVDYILVDLSDMKSVREAAEQYIQKEDFLDVLINNAADFDLSVKKPILTKDGLEKQFATNVAAPFLLSILLKGLLEKSESGRIINISSQGLILYPFMKLDFENLSGQKHYSPAKTYYQNKLALLMLSLYMREHWEGIKVQAIRVTNVKVDMRRYNHLSAFMKNLYKIKSKLSISPEEMAKVYTALSTEDRYEGFLYDEKCKEVKANAPAYEEEEQEKLYSLLEHLTFSRDNP
ncbi:dehydrogenase [Streptococcus sp. GMD4S]|uniref:Dehydrogenase n=1 Tax=Streptococcus oralis subsp. oralis TaxID=1891914 RepID=A0A1X1HPE2_STROR|nr:MULTISPECIES: SDR family NAD(P)-dependent oxidoreductase [Streptococcus]EKA06289.1 dehydrogenase [Streptococcus sp. GMD2S]EKA06970.1 dehydrogenase [Streptococcus sp. GMD6S]EKA10872.1 dehydrogenase [Streptococcus sp. GMD1S]EKA11786.1 dehydrogenase [Streptococcus sp. GMD4S]ORO62741.1 dehydrogenase [Streptococcus oralis subsp. oralis]